MGGSGLRALTTALAICLICAAPVAAQEFSRFSSPILTLDQERLFNGSLIAERVTAEIVELSDALAAENRNIEADLVAEELDLTDLRPTLPVDEFRNRADAFDEKVQAIRAEQDAKSRELQVRQEAARQDFLRQITPVLAEIVREHGAVVVLDRRSVLLSADAIDITDEAIARINSTFGDGASPQSTPVPTPDNAPELTPVAPDPDTPIDN